MIVPIDISIVGYICKLARKNANELDVLQLLAKRSNIPHHLNVIDSDYEFGNTRKYACIMCENGRNLN